MASEVFPWGSHQTLPQNTKTGGHLKLQNYLMAFAVTFTSWEQAVFRSTCVGEVLIPFLLFKDFQRSKTII